MQGAVLSILHCLLNYVDFNLSSNAQQVNADLLRVIAKYIEIMVLKSIYRIAFSLVFIFEFVLKGAHWKEALKILKLAVTRSSSLVAPPSSASGPASGWGSDSNASSFSDSELFVKKELPGIHVDIFP
jgi:hypothetical protein